MDIIEKYKGVVVPHLGISAASFAAVLTILTINPRPELATAAVENFAIGIPVSLAPLFFPPIEDTKGLLKKALTVLNSIIIYIGIIPCLLGLHKCFKLVSPTAGENFGTIIVTIVIFTFAWAIIYDIYLTFREKEQKKIDHNKANSL